MYNINKTTVERSFLAFKKDVCAAAVFLGLDKQKKHVAITGANSYPYIAAWFAVTSAGSIAVPLDWQRKDSDLADLIADSESEIVLYGEEAADFAAEYSSNKSTPKFFISKCRYFYYKIGICKRQRKGTHNFTKLSLFTRL